MPASLLERALGDLEAGSNLQDLRHEIQLLVASLFLVVRPAAPSSVLAPSLVLQKHDGS